MTVIYGTRCSFPNLRSRFESAQALHIRTARLRARLLALTWLFSGSSSRHGKGIGLLNRKSESNLSAPPIQWEPVGVVVPVPCHGSSRRFNSDRVRHTHSFIIFIPATQLLLLSCIFALGHISSNLLLPPYSADELLRPPRY